LPKPRPDRLSNSSFSAAPGLAPPGGPSLSTRWYQGAGFVNDRSLHRWMVLLDEAFRVPGTRFRFGLDGIIGLVPAAGDVLAGLLSLVIPIAAWIRGVPYVTLVRMAVNIGIGVLVGAVPFFGDIFLVAWKANRRNYNLLQLHVSAPRAHTGADWLFLAGMAMAMALILALPIMLLVAVLMWIARGI